MKRSFILCGLLLAACAPAAETKPAAEAPKPVMLTEAEAQAIADKLPIAVLAGDAKGVIANFAPDAIAFDAGINMPVTDTAANLAATEAFVKLQPSKFTIHFQKVQVLDADNFVATTVATGETKTNAPPPMLLRITDVFHKQADGSWKVANEHMSMAPERAGGVQEKDGPKPQPLPVVRTFPAQ